MSMTEREALEHTIQEHTDMVRYLEGNVRQWKMEHIYPHVVANWVKGITNWEETVDFFLEKHELLVNAQRTLANAKHRLSRLDKESVA